MRVGTLSRRRLCESSLFSSARFCEDPLQLKHVTSECCPVRGVTEGEGRAQRKVCLNTQMLKRVVGQGPVKGSLFNEDMALHEAV